MSIDAIVEIIHTHGTDQWQDRNRSAFDGLFGGSSGRYPVAGFNQTTLRAPKMTVDDGVPFAAYIHPDNPTSGAYSGMSFVLFPIANGPCLVGLGTGTQGLAPDEAILGRPGHARKTKAIASWLNTVHGSGTRIAWAKHDPTRTDIAVPEDIQRQWSAYASALKKYGQEMYALFAPTQDRGATRDAVSALLDLMMRERGIEPLSSSSTHANEIRSNWFKQLMPQTVEDQIAKLLGARGFVILQGPPGTGKTRMATSLLMNTYSNFGQTIQFHPNTSYENLLGGLAPIHSADSLGLQFAPKPGFLMEAVKQALQSPERTFLLHIDEINRADLGKVLGEAILLLEWNSDTLRSVTLPYDFGAPFGNKLHLPKNLHILGTMNTADRSIAIVDLAVRRRFAFVSVWPDVNAVAKYGCTLMQSAFQNLLEIFVEYSGEEGFNLIPGHAYFLKQDDTEARRSLKTDLAPLLEEYLTQGFVSGFAEHIRSYMQWLQSL